MRVGKEGRKIFDGTSICVGLAGAARDSCSEKGGPHGGARADGRLVPDRLP